MLAGGKAWDIAERDLLDLARAFDIRRPAELLETITHAIARWPYFADQAGVPAAQMERIRAYQPEWTRRRDAV
jgi:serine/threonine-protein kinase HipA